MDEPSTDPSGSDASIDDEQYIVVRRAVEDALWSVLGTAVYGVFLAFLLVVGLSLAAAGVTADPLPGGLAPLLAGAVLTIGAGAELVRTFGLFPSVRRRTAPDEE
jgi:hypothetical protein